MYVYKNIFKFNVNKNIIKMNANKNIIKLMYIKILLNECI